MDPGRELEPDEYEILSPLATTTVILQEIARVTKAILLNRSRRDRARVAAEYDLESWKNILEKKPWRACTKIEDFINPRGGEKRIAKIQNKLVRLNTHAYYEYRGKVLQQIIRSLAADETEILELGCGIGSNMLFLLSDKGWRRLIGLDISDNAIRAASEIAKHFGLDDRVSFSRLDLTDGNDPNLKLLKGKTVFTYYCLEQLRYETDLVITNVLKAGIKRMIHIEPTTELLKPWLLKDMLNYLYIKQRDYQDNLVRALRSFEERGAIKIIMLRRLYYAPSMKNDPTLICWEPQMKIG